MPLLDGLFQGFVSVFNPAILPYLVGGTFFGFIIGVIPGLGGSFAMAMLIPFIYRMDAATGLAFLLAAHAAVSQGGGLTAILFSVPGTGSNAATLLDGPAMTAKGEPGRAVGAAMTASFLGAFFGVFVLTLLLPILGKVVLLFGPPEFFMLTILALSFIAVLGTQGNVNKGLIAGALGLIFAFVGMDAITGERRFTFGILQLWDGFTLVPTLLGIFAVSEMIDLWIEGGSLAGKTAARDFTSLQKQIFRGIWDTFRHWWLVLRCSGIGTTIGLIPGLGSGASTFIAYAHAKQTSKRPQKFGTGIVEGVIAPQAANDAVEGGALASTLAFGIPGSSSMAILISALFILGIEPGPGFIAGHLDLVFLMIWTLVFGNLIGTLIGMWVANPLARVTFLRASLLVPVLLTIILTGCFVVRDAWFDIIIGLVFGLLGYAMKKLHYSRPAFIIGFIMGVMLEINLFQSVKLYGVTFFLEPLALSLLIVTAVVLIYNIYTIVKSAKQDSFETADVPEKANVRADLLFGLFLLALLGVFFAAALGYKPITRRAPMMVMAPLAVMLAGHLLMLAKKIKQIPAAEVEIPLLRQGEERRTAKAATLGLWVMLLLVMIYLIGYTAALILFLVLFLRFASHERWSLSISVGIGTTAILYILFEVILMISLYPGAVYNYVSPLIWE